MRLAVALLLGLLGSGCASAAGDGRVLSPTSPLAEASRPELATLETGRVVTVPYEFDRDDAHYIGGRSVVLVRAPRDSVLAALDDAAALRSMLPATKSATLIATEPVRKIELVQGNSVVEARYTVELVPRGNDGEIRFQLDRSRPHDIDDVYGYFRVDAAGDERSVVTVAAAVHLSGLTEMFFGKRVQDVILSAPFVMRDYFARQDLARGTLLAQNDHR